MNTNNFSKKTILITGATSGIGLATAKLLAHPEHRLVLMCRNLEKGQHIKKQILTTQKEACIELMICDLSSQKSIRQMATQFYQNFEQLDVLINNAGVYQTSRFLTEDGFEMTFAVNHLAPFLLTHLLLPALNQSPKGRIITVSSGLHKAGKIWFDDLQLEKSFSGMRAYSQSKLANILFTRTLARQTSARLLAVNCLHPGVIATALVRGWPAWLGKIYNFFLDSPEKGAETSVYLALSQEPEALSSGNYFVKKKITNPSDKALDDVTAQKLWEKSLELTKMVL